MERKRTDSAGIAVKAGVPLGLAAVQLVVGYEWLMSGLTKLVHGDFPGGLADNLAERSAEAPGWYRSFLTGMVVPHAHAFGYLVESAELATGLVLVAAALALIVAWERLPMGARLAVLAATAAAATVGFAMSVAFHLASGSGEPFLLTGDSFDEAVDLDSVMAALELVLVGAGLHAIKHLTRKEMVLMKSRPNIDWFAGKRSALWAVAALVVGLALGGAVLGGKPASAAAKDRDVTRLQAELAQSQQDAAFWKELTSVLKPAPATLRSMQDHRLYVLPSGVMLGLHFDNMNLAKAKHLNWVVFGVPGVFTKADQQRVERVYGTGFVHFHDLKADTHGGKPGAKGAWFVHIGARDFQSPFGQVNAGAIDPLFMPTRPKS